VSESLILRQEHIQGVSENNVMWLMRKPEREEATEDWRELPNEKHCNLYSCVISYHEAWQRTAAAKKLHTEGLQPQDRHSQIFMDCIHSHKLDNILFTAFTTT
jgi:hypothetical protein